MRRLAPVAGDGVEAHQRLANRLVAFDAPDARLLGGLLVPCREDLRGRLALDSCQLVREQIVQPDPVPIVGEVALQRGPCERSRLRVWPRQLLKRAHLLLEAAEEAVRTLDLNHGRPTQLNQLSRRLGRLTSRSPVGREAARRTAR